MANDQELKFKILAQVVGGRAVDDLRKSVSDVGDSAKGLKQQFESASTAIKGLAAAYGVTKGVEFIKSIIDMGDELAALSERTGISVRDLYAFKGAAEDADLPFDGLINNLRKFTQNLAGVKTGNKEFVAGLRAVGVTALDSGGHIRNAGDVIRDLSERFSKMADGPEKAKVAITLFGKAGLDVVPFLNQGAEALSHFSSVIDDDFARRADQFNDTMNELGRNAKAGVAGGLSSALPALQEIASAFANARGESEFASATLATLGEVLRDLVLIINPTIYGLRQLADVGLYSIIFIGDSLLGVLDRVGRAILALGEQGIALVTGDFAEIARIGQKYQADQDATDANFVKRRDERWANLVDRLKSRTEDFVKFQTDLSKNSFVFGQGTLDEIAKRQREATQPGATKKSGNIDISGLDTENANKLEKELATAKALREAGEAEYAAGVLKAESYRYASDELKKLIAEQVTAAEISKATKNMTEEGAAAYRDAAQAVLEQKKALVDLEAQQKQSYLVGAAEASREYLEMVKDVAGQTKAAFANAFRGMEDALVDFAKTGKLNFRDFANSVISDIIRIAARQAIIAPLVGVISSVAGAALAPGAGPTTTTGGAADSVGTGGVAYAANGGIMTSRGMAKLRTYASGGIANSPQLAVFGEGSMPEAYVPLPDGRSIPVNMKGAGGGDMNLNVIVNVTSSGESTATSGDADQTGRNLASLVTNAVKAELIQQRRPGGLLA